MYSRSSTPGSQGGAAKPGFPSKFRCKVGGEWLPLSAFSNNQQKMVLRQADRGAKVDAAMSGMTCRDHSSHTNMTLRCDLCRLVKPRSDYSKNSLKDDDPRCKVCVAWVETQEPSINPAPLATGHISPEELNNEIYAEDWTDMVTSQVQVPITELSSLGLTEEEQEAIKANSEIGAMLSEQISSSNTTRNSSSDSGNYPSAATSVSGESTSTTQGQSRPAKLLPPHLRGRATPSDSGQSSSGATSTQGRPNTISTATTLRVHDEAVKASRKIPYNAWDSHGTRHEGLKTPTAASDSDAMSLLDSGDESSMDEWPQLEAAPAPVQPATKRGKNKWFKAPPGQPTPSLQRKLDSGPLKFTYTDPEKDHQIRHGYLDNDEEYEW